MVNLTKDDTHRNIIAGYGVLNVLYDILTSSYAQSASLTSGVVVIGGNNTIKIKILEQVCIIIGQYCNEVHHRKCFQTQFEHTVPCIVFIYMQTAPFSKLASKALFALKQVSVDHGEHKLYITGYIARKLA